MIKVDKGFKCNQCGDKYFKKEMKYFNKVDGPYCKYCVNEWKEYDEELC